MKNGMSPSLAWAAPLVHGELWGGDVLLPLPVVVDSRLIKDGEAFLALKGEHHDGHRFIGEALDRGAKVFFGEREGLMPWRDRFARSGAAALAFSRDSEASFVDLARLYLEEVAPQTILAITGSVGKTTCRELTALVLAKRFRVHQARKSHNTALGCALTVLAMDSATEMLLLEMGCNHRGEIAEMVDLFPPHLAVITEVAPAHLEGLGSIEGVLRAKLEILRSRNLRAVSYNIDNDALRQAMASFSREVDILSVGYHREAIFRLVQTTQDQDEEGVRLFVRAHYEGGEMELASRLFGRHHAYSMGFAGAVASYLGIDDFGSAFRDQRSLTGRGRVLSRRQGGVVVDESYNANPLSMRAALTAFREVAGAEGNWALLGAMGELGPTSADLHRLLLSEAPLPERVLLLGEGWPATLPPGARRVAGADEAIALLTEEMAPGEALLVKGSRLWKLERVVQKALSL
ncbi:UDP-N-acetylmuramoyl-tripeptide--D-alanyl-D-alanine ligase [Aminithiophilus ramosus]|uniref:UDP-N-acetylmuramoyl-tripeptide--D-alanyl-D-alanine ligase n=2 Tax=Synergistales TaxID=649776 RepID=A0A9Q7EWT2_9BACT|nr:UDP-N-acetylmuramoyl-tripeptide--D-alanyl-D-alanine ligase [Aminithiophilus ramosus]